MGFEMNFPHFGRLEWNQWYPSKVQLDELHLLTTRLRLRDPRRTEITQNALYVCMMCGWDLSSNYWEERCCLNVLFALHKLTSNRMYLVLQEFDLATLSSRRNVAIAFLYPFKEDTRTLIHDGERIENKYWEVQDDKCTGATDCLCRLCLENGRKIVRKRVEASLSRYAELKALGERGSVQMRGFKIP